MLEEKVKEIVEDLIKGADDLFLVEVKVKGNTGNQKILVFIDSDNGLSIDACSALSRQIGMTLEEADIIDHKYTLEVSSPGLDFPLMLIRQYKKNVGRELVVRLNDGTTIAGTLAEVNADKIVLGREDDLRTISFEEIKQSKVKISFK